jgi:hypothetical protein
VTESKKINIIKFSFLLELNPPGYQFLFCIFAMQDFVESRVNHNEMVRSFFVPPTARVYYKLVRQNPPPFRTFLRNNSCHPTHFFSNQLIKDPEGRNSLLHITAAVELPVPTLLEEAKAKSYCYVPHSIIPSE